MERASKVLIVDDSPAGREALEGILSNEGYDLEFAASGPEALQRAAASPPDLILLDVMMPEMDGFEVCRRIRADSDLADLPVVLVTALDDRRSRVEGAEAGADDFISKPYDRAELRMRVRSITRLNRFRRLLQERAKVEQLINLSPDGILVVSEAGNIELANPAVYRLLGMEADGGLEGRPLFEYISPDHRDWCLQCFQNVVANQLPLQLVETEFVKNDGTTFPSEVSAGYCEWEGEPSCEVIIRDITSRRDAAAQVATLQAQVRHAQKLETLGTLAGGIAHDFNNILTPILGYTNMVLRGLPEGSQEHSDLTRVFGAGKRAKDLVQQILTFARQSEQELSPLQLHLVVGEALNLLRASLPSNIEIKQQLETTDDTIMADPTQMHQLVMNLCTNAFQAIGEEGGRVEVSAKAVRVDVALARSHPLLQEGEYMRLAVSDNGPGMDKVTLQRVFEPFFTTKSVGEGTGLGLAVVHGIVASHGGVITVDSVRGEGASFVIYLPLADRDAEPDVAVEGIVPRGDERILLVDDDEEIARMSGRMLEDLGYDVVVKTTSPEALETFREQPGTFAAVITDQMMPDMTGVQLARELKSIRPDIPIIVATGAGSRKPKNLREIGICEHVIKPFLGDEIGLAVRRALDSPHAVAE